LNLHVSLHPSDFLSVESPGGTAGGTCSLKTASYAQ
jgi:hypothetical protein